MGLWYPRQVDTRSRRYTGTPVEDVPTSTSPISRVLWNSAVASMRTFLVWVSRTPAGAVTLRAFSSSLILATGKSKEASRSCE